MSPKAGTSEKRTRKAEDQKKGFAPQRALHAAHGAFFFGRTQFVMVEVASDRVRWRKIAVRRIC